MRLTNKTAIITGGGTGIGRACAEIFSREGANVAIFGRRKDRLEATMEKIQDNIIAVQGDVTREDDIDTLINNTLQAFGKIDILVNNAGIFSSVSLHEMGDPYWDEMMNVNLRSVFQLTRKVLGFMMEQKSGNFIHIASILGMVAAPQTAAYNTSKAGLIQLSQSIAVEYGPHGIRSNAVCPGLIATEMTADLMSNRDLMKEWSKDYPIGRFGVPEDVAGACLFLASEESSFITGAVLPVDGGFTAH